jgi:hypothetical protein
MDANDEKRDVPRPRLRQGRSVAAPRLPPRQVDDTTSDPDLCRCGSCGSMLVQPIEWDLVGRCHWRVTLGCPNCGWSGTGVFTQEAVDRYDRDLDRGTRKLTTTLNRVAKACMESEIERFVHALEHDLIVPFDF